MMVKGIVCGGLQVSLGESWSLDFN